MERVPPRRFSSIIHAYIDDMQHMLLNRFTTVCVRMWQSAPEHTHITQGDDASAELCNRIVESINRYGPPVEVCVHYPHPHVHNLFTQRVRGLCRVAQILDRFLQHRGPGAAATRDGA